VDTPLLRPEIEVETPLLRVEIADDSEVDTPLLRPEIEVETPLLRVEIADDSEVDTPLLSPVGESAARSASELLIFAKFEFSVSDTPLPAMGLSPVILVQPLVTICAWAFSGAASMTKPKARAAPRLIAEAPR
jgi:hypothetical protein